MNQFIKETLKNFVPCWMLLYVALNNLVKNLLEKKLDAQLLKKKKKRTDRHHAHVQPLTFLY